MTTPIDQTDLSVRTKRGLLTAGYYSVEEALLVPHWELLRIPNFGRKSLNELQAWANNVGKVAAEERWRLKRTLAELEQRYAIMGQDIAALRARLDA